MSILESLELALKNIVSSKVRTLLTMLGIIIGVAAVIVIVGLGNGLEGYVTESFSDMGTNTLTVTVMSRGSTRSLDVEDMYDIVEENSEYLDLCSPTVTMAGYVKIGSETVDTTTSTGVSEGLSGHRPADHCPGAEPAVQRHVHPGQGVRHRGLSEPGLLRRKRRGSDPPGGGARAWRSWACWPSRMRNWRRGGSDDCLYLPYTTAERITGETQHVTPSP